MNSAELDQLVAQIGEEILARVNRPPCPRPRAEHPDQVCPAARSAAPDLRREDETNRGPGCRPRLSQRES